MRILHINCNYIGTTLHQLMIEELDKLGVENEVFVPTYDKNIAVIKPNSNVYVSECFNKWDRLVFDYKQRKIIKAIEDHYDVSSYDLIHAYTVFTDGNVARYLSKKYGIPYVVAVRNTDVNDFFKHMVHLRKRGVHIMDDAKKIFYLSNSYKINVMEQYVPQSLRRRLEEKSLVIPNGIDSFWFDNKNTQKDINSIVKRMSQRKLKIVYAGIIDKNKNISETIAAIKILVEKGWDVIFDIVGKVKDQNTLDEICSYDFCKYHKPVSKEGLIEFYRASDVFVMPSHTETFGLTYAEAMTQGLPVLYTKGQGFDKQFDEGVVGFHVSDQDPNEIVDRLMDVINDYQVIVNNCLYLSDGFRWKSICSIYETVYRGMR